ncbi:hypothetical protein KJ953_03710 [Patescibacteria group bacterium]|nr:hypothetical protein [Patescibacteria group bacterium]MBU1256610.1 hypothetical protein [Patescibacteria group bacterium]MBU1457444.1 hypothetical protein [Patescibacteria group bacterium]
MPNEYRPAADVEPILDMQSPVPLTDPIAEDISRPAAEIKPALSPQRHSPSFTLPLIIITLLAVTAASLFYTQTQQLKVQVQDLTNTIATGGSTSPEVEPPKLQKTIEITPKATPSATPSANPILTLAQAKYPDAQLILITSDNPHLEDQTVTKYWFRQSPDAKNYLYISFIAGESSLVDQQVYVSPDNNIPSLNQRMENNQLGLTQAQALALANSLCKEPEKCQQATAIKTQFLDTSSSLLWQITYQLQNSSQPVIFQINSLTKEVVYQSQK